MGILSALSALNEVGLTQAKLDAAVAESVVVKAGIIAKTKEVQKWWADQEAPVSDRGEHVLHLTQNYDAIDHPGDYKSSIMVRYELSRGGFMVGVVFTVDPKAWLLEYGGRHNPEHGFKQKTVDHFNTSEGGKYAIAD